MKLLIITQTVDKNDDVLGFFHRWLQVFAKHFELITVICLNRGEVDLPGNVSVYSLGKEKKYPGKMTYVKNFIELIVRHRDEYDTVFVHMNQEYILLGAPIWKGMGKKVTLWRNHPSGNSLTRLAVKLSDKVFCTSPSSYTASYSKTVLMPVGVDTEYFEDAMPSIRQRNSLLFFGRISPIKRPDLFIAALGMLKETRTNFTARIIGNYLPKDEIFGAKLKEMLHQFGLDSSVGLEPGVPHEQSLELYREAEVYINLTPSGSMDKTIFEAMSCGVLPVIHNSYFKEKIDNSFVTQDKAEKIAQSLEHVLSMSEPEKKRQRILIRKYVVENHSLDLLGKRLKEELAF
jgi:glycosyltransferase involved in cell wall biosynthesis